MPMLAEVGGSAVNPALGVLIFVLGGLAGAVFYLPFKRVKNWAWESYWLVYAVCRAGRRAVVARRGDFAERHRRVAGRPRRGTEILLPLRALGRRRTHLGIDDPLSGLRPRAGHRIRPLFRRGHLVPPMIQGGFFRDSCTRFPARSPSAASSSRCWASCGRRRGHEQGARVAGRGEKGRRRRIQLQAGPARGGFLRPDQLGNELLDFKAARRSRSSPAS